MPAELRSLDSILSVACVCRGVDIGQGQIRVLGSEFFQHYEDGKSAGRRQGGRGGGCGGPPRERGDLFTAAGLSMSTAVGSVGKRQNVVDHPEQHMLEATYCQGMNFCSKPWW